MRKIFIICLVLLTPLILRAQDSDKWTKIASPKGDFQVLLPDDFLVDNEDDMHRAFAYRDEVTIRIEIENTEQAKFRLWQMRNFRSDTEAKISAFKLGDFIGDVHTNETEKFFSMSIYAASSKAFHRIWISTRNKKSGVPATFINSITFSGQKLVKQPAATNQDTENAVSLASLKTDPRILEALRKPDASRIPVRYQLEEEKEDRNEDDIPADTNKYSRPWIAVRRPQARYTDNGREKNIEGTVKLKITFRADGTIGGIIVLKELKGGLTDRAIEAARRIKFLPAEIDGKAVEVIKTVSYTFTIY